jgi:hypothetical protein
MRLKKLLTSGKASLKLQGIPEAFAFAERLE